MKKHSSTKSSGRSAWRTPHSPATLIRLCLALLLSAFPALAQTPPTPAAVTFSVTDPTGAGIAGARIDIIDRSEISMLYTDEQGHLTLNLPAGLYEIGISATGYGYTTTKLHIDFPSSGSVASATKSVPVVLQKYERIPPGEPAVDQQSSGMISGTVVDQTGAAVAGARIKLTREDQSPSQEVSSDDDGRFSYVNIPPGPFYITITSAGFATQTYSGTLRSADFQVIPPITLPVATAVTEVTVEPTAELAKKQIKEQEKQRVLGVIPNFYVSYVPDAVPLTPKQKYELAWKTTIDPVTFLIVGGTAGLEQAQNQFSGYGQGAQGYGKRYGAAFADAVTSTFLGGAVLPSLMKQDPRYFYKGTGTTRSRILYAIANAVICKGDNGHWQFNYSGILGGLASGGISNAYYPQKDRGAGLVFENEGIGIGGAAVSNLIQEFLIPKLTPNLPNHRQATP